MSCWHDKIPDNTMLHLTAFARKSLSSVEYCYSNKECNALRNLHGLEKIHHNGFVRAIYIITDHKSLVVILSKDVATLPQTLQYTMLRIHQYSVYIIYKSD